MDAFPPSAVGRPLSVQIYWEAGKMRAGILGSVACVGMMLLTGLSAFGQQEKGLVGCYAFEKGAGTTVPDRSGRGNNGKIIGGAKWAKGPYGSALELDGEGAYVDCGTGKSLNVASGGTVMVWCRPKTLQGGLVNWSTGGSWEDQRLVLAVKTWGGATQTLGCMADGKGFRQFGGFGMLPKAEWTHLAYTFDGRAISVYRDGLLSGSASQLLRPEIVGVPLWIGKCQGLGKDYFHGLIDEVRIYNRPLAGVEILVRYKKEAEARGKDMSVFHKVGLDAQACPGPGKIIATLDARGMQPLPEGTQIRARLFRSGSRKPTKQIEIEDIPLAGTSEGLFDVQKLRPGTYVIRADAVTPGGARIGEESSVTVEWTGQPAAFRNVKVLNNLCWELLNIRGMTGPKRMFTLPCDRWVFIRTTAQVGNGGELQVGIDSDARESSIILHSEVGESVLEAMRYLKAGEHTIHIGRKGEAKLTHLIVRAVPELQHAFYYAHPHIHPYGPYDWEFISKDVLPNINTMVQSGGKKVPAHFEEWKKMGLKWIVQSATWTMMPTETDEAAVNKVYDFLTDCLGVQHPGMDGTIMNEFSGGDHTAYDLYRKAIERIQADPKYKGKTFSPYGGTFYGPDRSREFARVCIEGGGYISWERYLIEQPTQDAARRFIHANIVAPMLQWEKGLPGCTRRMVVVLGYMSQPTESLNVDPTVNYRVYMDMQVRTLATHPALFGLGGVQEYHSSYSDEESVRWAGRLYRHYCIEGNTDPLTKDPYKLTHIRNPDFAQGAEGWALAPAEPGAIRNAKRAGYSWLQGRYPRTVMGDKFLVMKRSAGTPNRFSQTITDLKPGRLYSMKMITGDYQDLVKEISKKSTHAISITLDNVEILPGPKKSFQFTFPNCYAHHLGKFNRNHKYWMNYHWRVFRAKGTTAELTVSDWMSDPSTGSGQAGPGGPAGQELMFNFIEIQPYIGD